MRWFALVDKQFECDVRNVIQLLSELGRDSICEAVQQLAEIICLFLITVENSDQKQGCLPDQEALNEPSILAMLKKMALRA